MAYSNDKVDVVQKLELAARFEKLHNKKGNLLTRCEDYAEWTISSIFPRNTTSNLDSVEVSQKLDSLGARGVNYLANKLTMTLFQPAQPFFRILIADDTLNGLKKAAQDGDQDAAFILKNLDATLAQSEKDAMIALDYNRFRTEATTTAKLLIVTGNALIYHPSSKGGKVQVYSLRDYCVQRDLSGNVIEFITRDCKAFGTFQKEVQDKIMIGDPSKRYEYDSDITIYTRVCLEEGDGKFHMTQGADNIMLDSEGIWTRDELPWIPLTWNLMRGRHYGNGLVEDYAGAFHALDILTSSEVDVVAACAHLIWGVDPSSVVDVNELNKAKKGSYHTMKKDDVFALQVDKMNDMQIVQTLIDRLEHQLSTAFLLNSAVQRDAERVTAEEVRYVAQELETAHGGIYSRFAEEWQLPTARLMLKKVHINLGKNVYPQIITGLDSLSRAGEMMNLQAWTQDMAMLNGLPQEARAAIDMLGYASYCGVRRGVDITKILKTPEQMQAEQQQAMQMQQQQVNGQAAANVAQAAGESAVKGNQ